MRKNKNRKAHLSYWEENLPIERFDKWCGFNGPAFNHQSTHRIACEHVHHMKHSSVLDVGAGLGVIETIIQANPHPPQYTATEVTEKYVRFMRKKGLKVRKCRADKMPFKDEEFDCVLCIDVMNHQTEFESTISELIRVSKREVVISFFKPFLEDLEYLSFYKGFKLPSDPLWNTELGLCYAKSTNSSGEPDLVHTHFSRFKIERFLDSIPGVAWGWDIWPDGKVLLGIGKLNNL